jgi:hypothetical protein
MAHMTIHMAWQRTMVFNEFFSSQIRLQIESGIKFESLAHGMSNSHYSPIESINKICFKRKKKASTKSSCSVKLKSNKVLEVVQDYCRM